MPVGLGPTALRFQILSNSRGNAMISSIMLASLVGAAAFTAYRSFNVTYSSTRASRIKAKQAVMEAQVRRRAIQPEAYQDCDSGVTNRCHVRPEFFTDLNDQYVQGAKCGVQGIGNCGLSVKNLAFDPASRQFSAYVGYDGGEVNIKPMAVQLTVPTEVLQSPVFNCGLLDPLKPIFTGFDTNNQPKCEGFTACDKGSFVAGIDIGTRKLTCKPLPTSITCPQQNMFTHLGWAGAAVQYSCGELPDPPFTSRLNTRSVASVDPTGTPTYTDPDGGGGGGTSVSTTTDTGTGTGAGGTDTVTATNTSTSTSTSTSTDLHWVYLGDNICGSPQTSGGVAVPSVPYTTMIALGAGIDSYSCGHHLTYDVDLESPGMPIFPDNKCSNANATCSIYVNNHPPGMFSEGVMCWVCR